MLNNANKTSFGQVKMHDIHEGSDFRLHDDMVGQRLIFSVFSLADCGSFGVFL